ncbi:hypothetical protein [Ornithinimicrobium pratense]|uniref:Uncharacterized protein n=1 Tax=Ornithinimicrobium pratense TaxID=2593973 RepID=A0A5J6V2N8_9MICO|nr:hypothetical protein [Ornithinimicrobium pratense]QFG67958.1 hypothetical protein FY030_03805 [Ornithinimicrobium pratense]
MTRLGPDIEVWNRATSGVPWSDLAGDVALAHVLRFDGYAAAGSVLEAVEMEISEDWAGQGRAGFAWLGMDEVVALLDDVVRRYDELNAGDLEGSAHAARYDKHDRDGSARYAEVAPTELLTTALQRALTERPDAFAPTTGSLVEPRSSATEGVTTSADPVLQLLHDAAARERAAYAQDLPAGDKLLRSAQALTAFGLAAGVEDGQLVLQPWADEEDQLVQAVFTLLDLRYPEP